MFSGVLLMLPGMLLAMGSFRGVALDSTFLPALIARIVDEEPVFDDGLDGYREYRSRVRFRLIPWDW